MRSFRAYSTKSKPPKIVILKIGEENQDIALDQEFRNTLYSFENSWQDSSEIIYAQRLPIKAFIPVLLVEFPHLSCRFWFQVTTGCLGQWFYDALTVVNPLLLQQQPSEAAFHEFFLEELIRITTIEANILMSLVFACNTFICQAPEIHHEAGVLTANIYLEIDLDIAISRPSAYMLIHVCRCAKLKHVFEILCGGKLRGEFRLTHLVPPSFPFPGAQYSYHMASTKDMALMDTLWKARGAFQERLYLLPFPCGVTKYINHGCNMGVVHER